jgi:hypothetical protein
MDAKPILIDSEPSCQHDANQGHFGDGLRILARLIARDLIAKHSIHVSKDSNTDEHGSKL